MPIDLDTHDPSNPVDVEPESNQAAALCFLYANPDYGYKPHEVRDHTEIPNNSAYKALMRLFEKDLIGKTTDGYYHALEDPQVARFARSLAKGGDYDFDTGEEDYPDSIDQTTTGFPDEDTPAEPVVDNDDTENWEEPYPNED